MYSYIYAKYGGVFLLRNIRSDEFLLRILRGVIFLLRNDSIFNQSLNQVPAPSFYCCSCFLEFWYWTTVTLTFASDKSRILTLLALDLIPCHGQPFFLESKQCLIFLQIFLPIFKMAKMKNDMQPTRATFARNFHCKKGPCWLSKFFHVQGTEILPTVMVHLLLVFDLAAQVLNVGL